jgi:hypothetical protein
VCSREDVTDDAVGEPLRRFGRDVVPDAARELEATISNVRE